MAAFGRPTRTGSTILAVTAEALEEILNRRSFMVSLFGGLAAASVAGMGIAQAATAAPATAVPNPEELVPALKDRLDNTEADFSQVVVRDRVVVRRPRPYRRPVVVRRTVVVRRPRPYRRPVVVRRRVIYR
jgi:hypothetical protein